MEIVNIPLDQIKISSLNTRSDLQAGTEDASLEDLVGQHSGKRTPQPRYGKTTWRQPVRPHCRPKEISGLPNDRATRDSRHHQGGFGRHSSRDNLAHRERSPGGNESDGQSAGFPANLRECRLLSRGGEASKSKPNHGESLHRLAGLASLDTRKRCLRQREEPGSAHFRS